MSLCFSCFVSLRRFRENLIKPFYFYVSRTCDSPGGTPSVISLALKITVTFFGVALAIFWNIIKMGKIEEFQRNLSTVFLKLLYIYLFLKILQKVKILMLRWNILEYLKKILSEYFSCNERLEIFLTYFCNILCYGGIDPKHFLKKI